MHLHGLPLTIKKPPWSGGGSLAGLAYTDRPVGVLIVLNVLMPGCVPWLAMVCRISTKKWGCAKTC